MLKLISISIFLSLLSIGGAIICYDCLDTYADNLLLESSVIALRMNKSLCSHPIVDSPTIIGMDPPEDKVILEYSCISLDLNLTQKFTGETTRFVLRTVIPKDQCYKALKLFIKYLRLGGKRKRLEILSRCEECSTNKCNSRKEGVVTDSLEENSDETDLSNVLVGTFHENQDLTFSIVSGASVNSAECSYSIVLAFSVVSLLKIRFSS